METMNFGDLNNENNNQAAPKAPQNSPDAPQGGDRSFDQKRRRKLIWAGIILAALILAVIGWQYWQYTQSPYYQQMKAVKAIEKDLKEQDKWGGKTPEETVRLFTEAVKKGDFELAAKYGREDQIIPKLERMKTNGRIEQLLTWLEVGEIKMFDGGGDADLKIKENGKELWVLSMHKSDGGTWKIDEF